MSKLNLKALIISCAFILSQSHALITISEDGSLTDTHITTSIKSTWQAGVESVVSAKEGATVNATLNIRSEDQGFETDIFIVAFYLNKWFLKDINGHWQSWNLNTNDLRPYLHKKLAPSESINIITNFSLKPGEVLTFMGYRAKSGQLIFNPRPLSFAVIDTEQNQPHRFLSQTTLENYLRETSQVFVNNKDQNIPLSNEMDFSAPLATAQDVTFGPPVPESSTTNLQTEGVDEADIIKTDGELLYILSNHRCDKTRYCLKTYRIKDQPVGNKLLSNTPLPLKNNPTGMFLVDNNQDEKLETLIILSAGNENQFNNEVTIGIAPDSSFYYGGGNLTNLAFLNVQNPNNIQLQHTASFKGSLLSSRIINKTLYLVTRYHPTVFYTETIDNEVIDPGLDIDGEFIDTELEIDSLRNKKTPSKEDIPPLPVAIIDGAKTPQIIAEQCYLPIQAANSKLSNNITSLMAISTQSPQNFDTTCIMGDVEAMYASPQNIYLTSSRWDTQNNNPEIESLSSDLVYNPEHQTDIHKFKINEGQAPTYIGSGLAKGHLGWHQDKKSFRMGEYKGIFYIATSIGDTWQNNSRTRVSLFKQAEDKGALVEVSHLDHLGKPGEKLFSARFTGDRGYLVTFRTIDPLYVLDLSDPQNPKVAGELEIEGYSDFLQPLNDQYLLGIGKDAIADNRSPDLGGRGAWYQGVKLSLFDISDPSNPTEVDKVIIGKRGTQSAALDEHHALTLLSRNFGDTKRIALPIELHDIVLQQGVISTGSENPANTYYPWNSSNLYVLDIELTENPSIKIKNIIQNKDTRKTYSEFTDRSVLVNNSVHYISNGEVISQEVNP